MQHRLQAIISLMFNWSNALNVSINIIIICKTKWTWESITEHDVRICDKNNILLWDYYIIRSKHQKTIRY